MKTFVLSKSCSHLKVLISYLISGSLGYWPTEKFGSCPPAKYPENYHDDYYSRDIPRGMYLV